MKIEIIVAIIASFTSMLVGVISLINSNRTAKMMEALKFKYDRKRSNQVFEDRELKNSIEALGEVIKSIQQVKDSLLLTIYSTGTSLDSETAIMSLSEARKNFFKTYENILANLKAQDMEASHKAKNLTLRIEMHFQDYLSNQDFASNLSNEKKESLSSFRNELTDYQNLLRDSMVNQLNQRLNENG